MTDNYIQLKNDNIIRFEIKDMEGTPTGEYLEFDLEDIELPIRYQEMIEKHKKNMSNIQNQIIIIDKRQDHKGKKALSSNEEAKIKALQEFFKVETEVFNKFLGENGVQKLLCGRNLRWSTLDEIAKIINDVIMPKLNITVEDMQKKIKERYKEMKEDKTLE